MDKIICLGRNYAGHAQEMGESPSDTPVIFLKPPSVRRQVGRSNDRIMVKYPPRGSVLHPECEIIVWVSNGGSHLSEEQAALRIEWVTVGLDLTLRDVQAQLKQVRHPWTLSKVFVDSAVLGPWLSVKEFPNYLDTEFRLVEGGRIRQSAIPRDMILKPAAAVAMISRLFPLCPGDIVFTGTPAGVDSVNVGSVLTLQWGKIRYEVCWESTE